MANVPPEERQAFFSLMDEYFASRPHLRPGGSGGAGGSKSSGGSGVASGVAASVAAAAGAAVGAAAAKSKKPAPPPPSRRGQTGGAAVDSAPEKTESSDTKSTADYYTSAAAAEPPPPQYTGPGETGGAKMAVALYTFQGSEANDLPVQQGERIELLEAISDDWWRARSTDGSQREGIVPANYIQLS